MNYSTRLIAAAMVSALDSAKIQQGYFAVIGSIAAEAQKASNALIWDVMSESLADAQLERDAVWQAVLAEAKAEAKNHNDETSNLMRGTELAMKRFSLPMEFHAIEHGPVFRPVDATVKPAKKGRIGFGMEPAEPADQSPPEENRRIGF